MAVLAAIIIPKFASQGKRSKEAALKSNMNMVRTALASCQADTGLWPATLSDLTGAAVPAANGNTSAGVTATWPAGSWHGVADVTLQTSCERMARGSLAPGQDGEARQPQRGVR